MADLSTLLERLARLTEVRAKGIRSYEIAVEGGTRRLEYRTDAELAAAIADVERQIAAASSTPVRTIHITGTRGT